MPITLKNIALNFLLGAALIFALAPFYILPLLILSLSGLLWQIHTASSLKMAIIRAYFFGLGYYFIGLSWLIIAFTFLPQAFQPISGFALGIAAILGFAAALSLFMAFLGGLSWFLPKKGLMAIIAQASLWTLISWLQGHLFTGFPWNPLAISLTFHPIFMQPAAFIGMYGLSFMAACIGYSYYGFQSVINKSHKWIFIGCFFCLFLASSGRYFYYDNLIQKSPIIAKIRAIQTGITVDKKWNGLLYDTHFDQVEQLMKAGKADYDAAILSETALPIILNMQPDEAKRLGQFLPSDDSHLLLGANIAKNAEYTEFENAFIALDKQGEIIHHYAKTHLVPFGEYMPKWLPFEKFVPISANFSRGEGPQSYQLPLFSYGPNICYEGIFPGEVIDSQNKPNIMINAATDSWYGNSHGPRQHAAQQKLRAVEEGLPLIRATDNGVSYAVNGIGQIEHQLPINKIGYFDYEIKPSAIYVISAPLKKFFIFFPFIILLTSLYREQKMSNFFIKTGFKKS